MRSTKLPDVNRRGFLAGAAATAIIPGGLQAQSGKILYVNSWGGVWTAAEKLAFFDPFKEATGITVTPVNGVNFNKIKAQVTSGSYEWDITQVDLNKATRATREKLLDIPDESIISDKTLFPGAVAGGAVHTCALGLTATYRTDRYAKVKPQGWADYWDVKKFPGPRAGYKHATRMLAVALVADGVPKDKLYPLDIDRGFRKLDEIKPHIKVWWTENTQAQQLIRDGEVDMIPMFAARTADLATQGVPVDVAWEGALCATNMLTVVRGAPNAKIAWEFIRFVSQPERQAVFCNRLFYAPANPKAYEFIKPESARWMPTFSENVKHIFYADSLWEADHFDAINERFNQWLSA